MADCSLAVRADLADSAEILLLLAADTNLGLRIDSVRYGHSTIDYHYRINKGWKDSPSGPSLLPSVSEARIASATSDLRIPSAKLF